MLKKQKQKNIFKRKKGLTLIELMLYVSLVAVVIVTISSFLLVVQKSRVRNESMTLVNDQGNFITDFVEKAIHESIGVMSPLPGTSGNSLVLRVSDQTKNPTTFSVDGGILSITEGLSSSVPLTDNRISISSGANIFNSQWGTSGNGNGQFYCIYGVKTDSLGNVYVLDPCNYRIQKFDSNGNYLTQWGSNGNGNGQFGWPYSLAIDSSNNVYVADPNNYRIEKFDSNGNYLTQWGSSGNGNGQFSSCIYNIATDSSNNVYVVDSCNYKIQEFDSSGNFLTQWGSSGNGSGHFCWPYSIGTDSSNNVYVADSGCEDIQKFDSNGNFLTQWGNGGSNNGQFSCIYGIVADSADNIYVDDSCNSRIQKFDSNGNFLSKFGSSGNGDGQFCWSYGLGADSLGNIYVADEGCNRIEKFASQIFSISNETLNSSNNNLILQNVSYDFNIRARANSSAREFNYLRDFNGEATTHVPTTQTQ